ncbi:MAG: hypothetical protein ACYC9O_16245 [Candidatus Latescibacterota bacterium]
MAFDTECSRMHAGLLSSATFPTVTRLPASNRERYTPEDAGRPESTLFFGI